MSNNDPAIATLEVKIENLTLGIATLNRSVEQNNEKLERLAVLEVSHNNSNAAIERAFAAVTKVEAGLLAHITDNERAHHVYDKWIWVAVGFCAAVSILWTLVGYRMNAMIDEQVRAVQQMQVHILEDKVRTPEDVSRIHAERSAVGKFHNGIPKP